MLGPNGAGKTTLLRVLSTAVRPTGGRARIFGHDVWREADAARARVDTLPAQGGVYPELTARENLRFALRMRGLSTPAEALAEALEWPSLARAAEAPARTLSTGMETRLVLARLKLSGAPLLLLDEPHGAIDREGRSLVDELLRCGHAARCGDPSPRREGPQRPREARRGLYDGPVDGLLGPATEARDPEAAELAGD